MKNILNRLKSWATWVSVAGAVWLILNAIGIKPCDENVWNTILNAIGTILVGFGILNNPTDKNSF